MRRRELLIGAASGLVFASAANVGTSRASAGSDANKLAPPTSGIVNVAFVISDSFNVIDLSGAWEVFQDAAAKLPDGKDAGFYPFTVAETDAVVAGTDGLQVKPNFTLANAPKPNVVCMGAQKSRSETLLAWIRSQAQNADVVMSVCTGAFLLAATGLLDGRAATTHHEFFDAFAKRYPKVLLQRGVRYVEGPKLATAAGLTSGIDLALRVVERYYGTTVAERTVAYMEYAGTGWRDPHLAKA